MNPPFIMTPKFYNYNRLNSYNALYNFVIGERGVGKTYGKVKDCIKDFINKDEQFVYVRRFSKELSKAAPKLLNPLVTNQEFPEYELKYQNNTYLVNNEVAGHALPLATSSILKSTSFDKVKTIIFDEFLLGNGFYRYLNNEVNQFLDLYETISRLRDIRVFFLANATSQINPYFDYFNLTLPFNGKEFRVFNNGLIVVNYIRNMQYRACKKASKFGRLIEGTEYSKYAVDNEWLLDSSSFIAKKNQNAKFYYSLILDNETIGVWIDKFNSLVFLSPDIDPSKKLTFTVRAQDQVDGTLLSNARKSPWFGILNKSFAAGTLFYENQKIKSLFLKYVNKFVY